MVKQVSSLDWQAVAGDPNELAAILTVDSAIDTLWRITLAGAPAYAPDGSTVTPNFLVVDNLANNGVVNIAYGPFLWVIPPFSRKTFPLPRAMQGVTILVNVGAVGVAFCQSQYAPDDANLFQIQQSAAPAMTFPPRIYTATVTQTAVDQNSWIEFIPTAADIIYNLIQGGTAPLVSGWFQFVKNTGTKNVSIKPAGTDVILGVFSNASPLILQPGDSGQLQFDGTTWNFIGHISYTSPLQSFTGNNNAAITLAHKLGFVPQLVVPYMKCKGTPDVGYTAGMIIEVPKTAYVFAMVADNINLNIHTSSTLDQGADIQLRSFNLGTTSGYNNTHWDWFYRADLWL